MASIGDIIGELESVKGRLGGAKVSVERASESTEEMAIAADAMDLVGAATELRTLNAKIESVAAGVVDLNRLVDELIVMTEALETAPGAGVEASGAEASSAKTQRAVDSSSEVRRNQRLADLRRLSTEKLDDAGDAVNFSHDVVSQAHSGWIQPPTPPTVTGSATSSARGEGPVVNALPVGLDGHAITSAGLAMVAAGLGLREALRKFKEWWNQGDGKS